MRIAICDDNTSIAGKIEMLILKHQHLNHIEFEIYVFYSGEELLQYLEKSKDPYDIVLLDIEMNHLTGIDVGKAIRKKYGNNTTQIIFISCHEERWKELFAVKPYGFISKPISEDEFLSLFFKCANEMENENQIFTYKYKNNLETVQIPSLLYFESNGRNVNIVTDHDRRTIHTTMKSIVQDIDNINFILIHKSFYVNIFHIEKLLPDFAVISNGDELPISRKRKKYVEEAFINYITQNKSKGISLI